MGAIENPTTHAITDGQTGDWHFITAAPVLQIEKLDLTSHICTSFYLNK